MAYVVEYDSVSLPIATDKLPLLPGESATFQNYSSYPAGINGIVIDILGLPEALSASDFDLRVGKDDTPDDWASAPAPISVTTAFGAGASSSDRLVLTWADGVITNTWLRVVVPEDSVTGLPVDDVFYFGNAIGESGDAVEHALVNWADELGSAANVGAADIENRFDFNRDGIVDATDESIAANNRSGLTGDLNRDDRLGLADLVAMQSHLNDNDADPYDGDLNGDRIVGRTDIAGLLASFGSTADANMLSRRLTLITPVAASPAAPFALTSTVDVAMRPTDVRSITTPVIAGRRDSLQHDSTLNQPLSRERRVQRSQVFAIDRAIEQLATESREATVRNLRLFARRSFKETHADESRSAYPYP